MGKITDNRLHSLDLICKFDAIWKMDWSSIEKVEGSVSLSLDWWSNNSQITPNFKHNQSKLKRTYLQIILLILVSILLVVIVANNP